MVCQLLDVPKNPLDELSCSFRIVQRNVIRDGVQIIQCRFGPGYFSHRDMRCLA